MNKSNKQALLKQLLLAGNESIENPMIVNKSNAFAGAPVGESQMISIPTQAIKLIRQTLDYLGAKDIESARNNLESILTMFEKGNKPVQESKAIKTPFGDKWLELKGIKRPTVNSTRENTQFDVINTTPSNESASDKAFELMMKKKIASTKK